MRFDFVLATNCFEGNYIVLNAGKCDFKLLRKDTKD